MKKIIKYIYVTVILLFFTACTKDFLEVEPLNKVPSTVLLSDASGLTSLLANLYTKMPMEDFMYNPGKFFNYHRDLGGNAFVDFGWSTSFYTDESNYSAGSGAGPVNDAYWENGAVTMSGNNNISNGAYGSIRQVNQFLQDLLTVKLDESVRQRSISEAHFIRAYMYFGLAKRYGGVPIIEKPQLPGEDLFVPRSTEKDTWDFILKECDLAIENLPPTTNANDGIYRATQWAAYALKSRVALYAASIAKYWDKAPLSGEAVDKKLVGGMSAADADNYYTQCLAASSAIIDNSGKTLYKPSPATKAEAAKNFQDLFQNPTGAMEEMIFLKAYIDGSTTRMQGHSYDVYFNPSQTAPSYSYFGRFNPTLDLVDLFEDYTDDGTGKSVSLVTRTDGVENEYVANPGAALDLTKPYKLYNTPAEIFVNKDARLFGSIITPGSTWKSKTMVIQGGLIKSDGTKLIYQNGNAVGLDGKTYYTYGGATGPEYSGFAQLGNNEQGNYTSSGFNVKKYLVEGLTTITQFVCTHPYIDFRLAEIYLNYAEAAIESGKGDAAKASQYLNALRKRASHTDNIPATIGNILKERRIELAFEGHRYWDLVRRRDYHSMFNKTSRKALVPVLDLRANPPKYIFVRANNWPDNNAGGRTFETKSYYKAIPDVSTSGLVQNPQY
jgi:starch-binding outer membrane protein, SusD/RagB family